LIVDVQLGLFGTPRYNAAVWVAGINGLSARMRAKQSPIIFIQHGGPEGDNLHSLQPGYILHSGLEVEPHDTIVAKASCGAFLANKLASILSKLQVDEVVITGLATDFCVDTTIRSALGQGSTTIVPDSGQPADQYDPGRNV
jgi:nicotinamidase-related amidase